MPPNRKGAFDAIWEGVANALSDIHAKVIEEGVYGRRITEERTPERERAAIAEPEREASFAAIWGVSPSYEVERQGMDRADELER